MKKIAHFLLSTSETKFLSLTGYCYINHHYIPKIHLLSLIAQFCGCQCAQLKRCYASWLNFFLFLFGSTTVSKGNNIS